MRKITLGILLVLALAVAAFSPLPQTPKRINFAPGATSAMVSGALPQNGSDAWVLRVLGGQTMSVNLGMWNGKARLVIFGADGAVLISDHADATYWSGIVPSTQDYNIRINALDNTAPSYTLDVTIPPIEPTPPAPGCINRAAFVADITVPDGTPWQPNQGFNKIWRVQNIGTCTWSTRDQLAFVGGEQMTNIAHVPVTRNVAPGQTFDFLVAMNAPPALGAHSGRWQMRDGNGAFFGATLWVKINTIIPIPPPQTAIVSPGNGFHFGAGATIRITFQGNGNTELTSVALYVNGAQVAKQTSRAATRSIIGVYDWRPGPGSYDLYAVATDIYGQQSTSAHVAGSITQPAPDCQLYVNYRADRYTINVGERVTLRWDVDCAQAVYLDGQGVTGHEARDVAPNATTTYTLRVIKRDGNPDERRITINVNNAPPPPPPPPPPQRRDINGHWSSGNYFLELMQVLGCSTADCHISGRMIHQVGTTTPQIFDVSGTFNVYSGAVSFAATIPGGQNFSGTVDGSSRSLSGNLSGVGALTFRKE